MKRLITSITLFLAISQLTYSQSDSFNYFRNNIDLTVGWDVMTSSELLSSNKKIDDTMPLRAGLEYNFRLGLGSNLISGVHYSNNLASELRREDIGFERFSIPLRFSYLILKNKIHSTKNGDLSNNIHGLRVSAGGYYSFNKLIFDKGFDDEMKINSNNFGYQIEAIYDITGAISLGVIYTSDLSAFKDNNKNDILKVSTIGFVSKWNLFSFH